MTHPTDPAAQKFDAARAGEYEIQSRIALAGYQACHELAACLLSAALADADKVEANVLVAGAGGGAQEVVCAASLQPGWRFTAVDPAQPMLDLAMSRVQDAGLADRVTPFLGYVSDLPAAPAFDAATLIGVLHHLPGAQAKREILRALRARMKPSAPLILAANRRPYASQPLFLAAWRERWRMNGAAAPEIEAKLQKILQGADPPASDEEIADLLAQAAFEKPLQFFSSLFWGAWIARAA